MPIGKYGERGAYHWDQVSRSLRHHNAFLSARYEVASASLGKVTGETILDIGGGDGALSYLIAQRGAQVVTTDVSHLALRYARDKFAVRGGRALVAEVSAYSLPFPQASFDAALCADVIEHLSHPEVLLGEAVRVLKRGGRFVLTTPLRTTEHPLDRTHVHEFYADELCSMLGRYFANVRVTSFAPLVLLELQNLPIRWLGNRPLFRYMLAAFSVYLKHNPFLAKAPFRYHSMLLAVGWGT